jgi:hypothetical protein
MSQDEFTKLFAYVSERLDGFAETLEKKADRADLDRIFVLLDEIRALLDTDEQERVGMNAQLDRREKWIDEASAVPYMPIYPLR